MVGHGGSSAGSYLTDPTSPIPSHCASIVATSTVRIKIDHNPGALLWRCHDADSGYMLIDGTDLHTGSPSSVSHVPSCSHFSVPVK